MTPSVRIRLSILFFFQFFIWGVWGVTMGTWMTELKFTAVNIGTAFGATSIAAMISPIIVGMVADRYFSAQRVLGVLHITGGVLLYFASTTNNFEAFFPLLLAHTLCYMPTLALVNAVAFSQMANSAQSFGGIRVMGTFGWIAAGFLVGQLGLNARPEQFQIGAGVAIGLGIYSFFVLPNVPPKALGQPVTIGSMLGLDALQLLRSKSFAVFAFASFLICIPLAFYYSGAERFLTQTGMQGAAAKMTLGQVSEIFFMLAFPLIFARLGVKKMLLLGMACWSLRYVLFAFGGNPPIPEGLSGGQLLAAFGPVLLLYMGIILHGPCFDFFFVTGQIYVDQQAPERMRAAAQGFIAFLTYGVGMLVGSIAQGHILQAYTDSSGKIAWSATWLIPAVGSAAVLVLFALLFKESRADRTADLPKTPLVTSPEGP